MEPEFAPEYTARERRHRLAVALLACVGLFVLMQGGVLPWWNRLVADAPCRRVLGVPGLAFEFYAVFVGLPWLLAALVLLLTGRVSIQVLRTRRHPPPGLKVYRRTRVIRGWAALLLAFVPLLVAALLVCFGVSGIGSTQSLLAQLHQAHPEGWQCPMAQPT